MDHLRADIEVRYRPPDEIQVLRPVGLVDALERVRRRRGAGGGKLERRTYRSRAEVPVGIVAVRLATKMKLAVGVDIAVGKDPAGLIAADRIAGVQVQAQ